MKTEQLDALARLRQKFFVKSTEQVGFAGAAVVKASEQVTAEERVVEVIATTSDVDLDDQVVDPAGADWSYFNAAGQKKVFQDHWYDSEHNVGIARSISPYMEGGRQTGWKMRIHVYTGLKCPYADDIWEKIKQGGYGCSIGFIPKEVGDLTPAEKVRWPNADSIVRKWKALELSFTPLPCNVKCQNVTADAKSVDHKSSTIEVDVEEIEC